MNFYSIALLAEAKPLIEKLELKNSHDRLFSIYENSDTKLIITGLGSINSSLATAYLLTKYGAKEDDFAFNFGLAGANFDCKIGDVFEVSKVIDSCSGSILTLPKKGKKILCHPTPVTKTTTKNTLVDMESYGFLKASKKFIKDENITIKKVVSDFLDAKVPTKEEVYKLMENL